MDIWLSEAIIAPGLRRLRLAQKMCFADAIRSQLSRALVVDALVAIGLKTEGGVLEMKMAWGTGKKGPGHLNNKVTPVFSPEEWESGQSLLPKPSFCFCLPREARVVRRPECAYEQLPEALSHLGRAWVWLMLCLFHEGCQVGAWRARFQTPQLLRGWGTSPSPHPCLYLPQRMLMAEGAAGSHRSLIQNYHLESIILSSWNP